MKKKFYLLLLIMIITCSTAIPAFAGTLHQVTFLIGEYTYIVNEKTAQMDATPFIQKGRSYVPVRYLALALGVPEDKIIWSPSARTVTLVKGEITVVMAIGGDTLYINDRPGKMDVVPLLLNGRTYMPARFVAEALGYAVGWDGGSGAVLIGPSGQLPKAPPARAYINVVAMDLTAIEQTVLEQINRDRKAAGLNAVAWDETAAQAARKHAVEMARNDYISHMNLSGEKPQQRYTEAGGTYCTMENLGYHWFRGYDLSQELVRTAVINMYGEMMAEVPPEDSHRLNVLDPHHTHVGVGVAYAVHNNGNIVVTFGQEFTRHYVELAGIPQVLTPGQSFTLSGQFTKQGYTVDSLVMLWEEEPKPRCTDELKSILHYSSPDRGNMVSYALKGWPQVVYQNTAARGNRLNVDKNGSFSATLQAGSRPGLNYLQVWAKDASGRKFMASEWVIKVQK